MTLISNERYYFMNCGRFYEEFIDQNSSSLEMMIEIAQAVCQLEGLDSRYTKQMEFVFPEKERDRECILSQVKILSPKNRISRVENERTETPRDLTEKGFRTYGVFDTELRVATYDNLRKEQFLDERIALLIDDFSDVTLKGYSYRNNVGLAIFDDGIGMLMHNDIPYFLYADGVAVGNRFTFPYHEETNQHVRLKDLVGKKARFRGDGRDLYVRPLEAAA